MEIIWVRHFMTPGNRKKQYIGSTDEPLDEEMIPRDLKDYPQIDALTVSPMLRCRQTAERIWSSMPFETEPLMRELDFGEYERKTYEELKNEPVYQAWLDSGGAGAFPGGEDRADFQKRCVQGAENMISRLIAEDRKRAGVVVHGGTIMAVLSAFDPEKRPFYHWQVSNGNGYITDIDPEEWKKGVHRFYNVRILHEIDTTDGEKLR